MFKQLKNHMLVPVAVAVVTLGCGSQDETTDQSHDHAGHAHEQAGRQPMNFNVDPSALGMGFLSSYGLRLWVPESWPQTSKNDMLAEEEQMAGEGFEPQPSLLSLYRNNENGATLRIMLYEQTLTRTAVDASIAQRRDYFEGRGATVQMAAFLHSGCEMDQIIAADEETVRVQLFVCNPSAPVYLLDFVVPRADYTEMHRYVESTIGTITVDPDNMSPPTEYKGPQ
jgi:hypothetical protein